MWKFWGYWVAKNQYQMNMQVIRRSYVAPECYLSYLHFTSNQQTNLLFKVEIFPLIRKHLWYVKQDKVN